MQLGGEPHRQEDSGRSKARREINVRILHFREMMMRCRMIEELSECGADLVQSRPVQIAKHNPLLCFLLRGLNQAHLSGKILPRLTVVNDSIDPRPQLRFHRLMQFALPPKIKRQVRIQVREYKAWQEACAWAFEQK